MHQWNWVCLTGSSVGSAIIVANRDIRQQSIRIAVKHHALTNASPTSRLPQDQISSKKIEKKLVLVYVECFKLPVECFGKEVSVL